MIGDTTERKLKIEGVGLWSYMPDWLPQTIERGPGFREAIGDLPRFFAIDRFGAGLTAAVFGCTGPAIIILDAAQRGGLTDTQAVSWLFAIYVVGGLMTIILALYYKQPICGAWTIPGAVLVGIVLADFNISAAVGAYFVSGILVLLIGLSGYFRDVVEWLPQPIIMGMVAGVLIDFVIDIFITINETVILGTMTLGGYLFFKRFLPAIPGIIGAIGIGTIVAVWQGTTNLSGIELSFATPVFIVPEFSLGAILGIALPLTVVVIGAENMQAIGVLQAEDYDAPINSMLVFSGIGGMITSFMGGHNANIAGPMTAITASEDAGNPREGRYVGSLIDGLLFTGFGLIAASATELVNAVPGGLVTLLAGIAMIGVLVSSMEAAFPGSGDFRHGAFFAIVIGISGVSFLDIGAPFWALVGGVAISFILEPDDWKRSTNAETDA